VSIRVHSWFSSFLLVAFLIALSASRADAEMSFSSTAPALAHPGMVIFFEADAYDPDTDSFALDYELLSAPTNATAFIGSNRGVRVLVFDWRVSPSLLGTTAEFTFRVSSAAAPTLYFTNVLRIPVVTPPPIHSLQFSNSQPVLTVTNLPVAISYEIQAASSVTASNWAVLTTTPFYAAQTRFVDTLATNHATRFYRVRPPGYTCYTANCP
jgi:hypothetical protein